MKFLDNQIEIFKKILDTLPNSVYLKDINGHYIWLNKVSIEQLKYKHHITESILGKTDFEVFPEASATEYVKNDQLVLSTGKGLCIEEQINIPNGESLIQLSFKEAFYIGEPPELVGILGYTIDMTERKKAELREKQALNDQAKAEQELRQAISILTGSIAHDLRNPIASIHILGLALKQKTPFLIQAYHLAKESNPSIADELPSWYIQQFEKLGDTVGDITSQMNQYIDTSLNTIKRAIAGDLKKEDLTLCDLNHCIQNVLMRYPFVNDERKLVHWDKKHHFKFLGNEILFFRMLSNLLKNSLYQIHQNGRGEIFISAEVTEQMNRLRFKDTAGGTSPEVVSQLFSGYRTTKKEGTGVGLSFCKLTMENFGGSIHCESIEGDYIEFIMEFPHESSF